MVKRQAKLQIGMDKLTDVEKLSNLQTQLLDYTWVVTSDFVASLTVIPTESFPSSGLRMKDKIQSVMEKLSSLTSELEQMFTAGVVNGFSAKLGPNFLSVVDGR